MEWRTFEKGSGTARRSMIARTQRDPMTIAFVINNEVYTPRVKEILNSPGIDYFTRWEEVKGMGHGTEAPLGTRSFPGTNSVHMIAFQEEGLLEKQILATKNANEQISRPDDHLRLFQIPLDRIV